MGDKQNYKIFANNLSYQLNKSGLSQKEFAKIINVPTSTVNAWLKEVNYPRIEKIEAMAKYFNITKADLIEECSTKTEEPVMEDKLTPSQLELFNYAKGLSDREVDQLLRLMKLHQEMLHENE